MTTIPDERPIDPLTCWYRQIPIARLLYPAILVLIALILTIAGLSGTSIGVISPGQPHDLIAGTPRPVRSDEWNVTTPFIVAQSHHSFSRYTEDSLGRHDLTVILGTADIPTRDWSTLFKPWNLPMLVLDLEHGFAARWWVMSLILLLGCYFLLLELTDRTDIAIFFSLGLWLSPFFQWWYESISLESVGMGMFALVFLLYALRAPTTLRRIVALALAAYSAISFILLLYPPFQVPIALVLGIIGVCEILSRHHGNQLPWRRLVIDLIAVSIAIVTVVIAYYLHTRSTLTAINNTVYPGNRRVTGGQVSLFQLLSAPFGFYLAKHGTALTTTNQSEISSFLLLGPFALLQIFRLRLQDLSYRWRLLLLGTGGGLILISAWYLLSLPPIVASVLLLDRAQASRTLIGIGVAGFLLMALFCAAEPESPSDDVLKLHRFSASKRDFYRRISSGALVCGVLAFGMYLWAGRQFIGNFPELKLGLWSVGVFSAGAAIVVWLTSARKVVAGGIAMVLFGAVVSLPANPLYQGLGALTSAPLLSTFNKAAAHPADPKNKVWLSYGGSSINDVLLASGLPTLNAADIYPDAAAWNILDPKGKKEYAWNRYANIVYVPGETATVPVITLLQATVVEVKFDPCGTAASKLHVGFIVSLVPATNSCLTLDSKTTYLGTDVYIYTRSLAATNR